MKNSSIPNTSYFYAGRHKFQHQGWEDHANTQSCQTQGLKTNV